MCTIANTAVDQLDWEVAERNEIDEVLPHNCLSLAKSLKISTAFLISPQPRIL